MAPPEARRRKLLDELETVSDLMTGIVHFALRLGTLCGAGDDLQRGGEGRLRHPGRTRPVRHRLRRDAAAAPVRHDVDLAQVLAKRNPREFFGQIKDVLVTAFSTSSSSATLPAALAVCRERLGIAPSTAGFVMPLGTTMNMSGTALYEGCVVLFVAQVFGVHLGFGEQVTLVFLSVLSAVAVAAIPGGSLPLIAGLLVAFGVPPEGIGIILGVDRLLDMTRTMTNVGSDLVTTAVVDRGQRASGHAGRV